MIQNLTQNTRVLTRLAALGLLVVLGACSSTNSVQSGGEAIQALNQAEEHLSRGRANDAVQSASVALAKASDRAIKVRALVLRGRARVKLGDLSMAKVDARMAESSLKSAFSEEGGARGIWQIEVDKLISSIDAGNRVVHRPPAQHTPHRSMPRWTPPTNTKPPPGKVAIESRSRWNASPIKSNRSAMTKIRKLTVHHTGSLFDSTDYSQSAQGIKSVQRYHQDSRGWADIGYHYLVDRAGRIWEGRSIKYQGAHAGNTSLNRGNVGICLLGNFDKQKPSSKQQQSLVGLIGHLRDKYSIPSSGVYTHQELKATDCPGGSLSDVVDRYRSGHFAGFTP